MLCGMGILLPQSYQAILELVASATMTHRKVSLLLPRASSPKAHSCFLRSL